MTRVYVYSLSLVALVVATALTLTAIKIPNWVTFTTPAPPPSLSSPVPTSDLITYTYGLHRVCLSLTSSCRPFPDAARDCSANNDEGHFCSLWRTTGFLMNAAVALELVALVTCVGVLWGGRAKRERGWGVVAALLGVVGGAQVAAMGIVAFTFNNYDRFTVPGFALGTSWILCTISWAVLLLSSAGILISAFTLPSEGGYEFID